MPIIRFMTSNDLYVQYGCGMSSHDGWINFDSSPTLRFERLPVIGKLYTKNNSRFPLNVRYGDIVKGLPLQNESCAVVYCSHVLEHLSLDDFRTALKNTFKVLKPYGVFRLVVPDLEVLAKKYVESQEQDAASQFVKTSMLGRENRQRTLPGFIKDWLGGGHHLWMWDFKGLTQELKAAGFIDIRKAAFNDSADLKFKEVEEPSRFEDAVCIECRKPPLKF